VIGLNVMIVTDIGLRYHWLVSIDVADLNREMCIVYC